MAIGKPPYGKRPAIAAREGGSRSFATNRRILFHTKSSDALELDCLRDAIKQRKVKGSDFQTMRKKLDLTVEDVTAVLGSSPRTIARKERGRNTLSPTEADRAYRLARIADLAFESIGDPERAKAWLSTRSTFLGNRTPLEMLDTEIGTVYVEQSLSAIAHGGVA